MPEGARVVLGGTFDRLHLGHKVLLSTALHADGPVAVGLTTDDYLAANPKHRADHIQPYAQRRRALASWLRRQFPGDRWTVVPLRDRFGRSITPGVRVLVASVETRSGALRVNRERLRRGLPALRILLVPLVLADDLSPVASTRIRAGVVDRSGKRRAPIRIGILGSDARAVRLLRGACRRVFPAARFEARTALARGTGEARTLARRWSRRALRKNELGFGIVTVSRPRPGVVVCERSTRIELYPRRLDGRSLRSGASLQRLLWPRGHGTATSGLPAKG